MIVFTLDTPPYINLKRNNLKSENPNISIHSGVDYLLSTRQDESASQIRATVVLDIFISR